MFYDSEWDMTESVVEIQQLAIKLGIKEIANRPFERTVEEMMQEKLVLIPREYWEEFC